MKIRRPGLGSSLLKSLSLGDFAKRFSHLTSRRKLAAHPDVALLQELELAVISMDPKEVASRTARFRSEHMHSVNKGGIEVGPAMPDETENPIPSFDGPPIMRFARERSRTSLTSTVLARAELDRSDFGCAH